MLAWCGHDWDVDTFSLLTNRVTILAVCAWGVWFCGRRAFGYLDGSLVPRWMWVPPAAIMATLAGFVLWFTATCTDDLSVWQRTVYGALLVWSVASLLAVITAGHSRLRVAQRKADEYRAKLEEAVNRLMSDGGDE